MTMATANWQLHHNALLSPLRIALFSITLIFALILQLIRLSEWESDSFCLTILGVLYLSVCYTLIKCYIKTRDSQYVIRVHDGEMSVPRFIFKPLTLKLCEIKSVEHYQKDEDVLAILVAQIDKPSICIERRNFASVADFKACAQVVSQSALENQRGTLSKNISVIVSRRESTKLTAIGILALTLLLTYAVLGGTFNENINESAAALGGLIKETLIAKEYYRIASSFFLHATASHLFFNTISLAMIGWNVDVVLGRARFINILFLSALCGAILSIVFSKGQIVIGASGGILGLFAAYFTVCVRYRNELPGSVSTSIRRLSLVLITQLLLDVSNPSVDICSHIGGFMFGLVYACIISCTQSAADASTSCQSERWLAIGVAFAYTSGLIYFLGLHFGRG